MAQRVRHFDLIHQCVKMSEGVLLDFGSFSLCIRTGLSEKTRDHILFFVRLRGFEIEKMLQFNLTSYSSVSAIALP